LSNEAVTLEREAGVSPSSTFPLLSNRRLKLKICIYVRVSTEGQNYEQQVSACTSYCRIKGWTDVVVFSEKESSNKLRPVWEECLRQARQGRYSVILVFRLDRAWRSSRQFIMDFDSLQSHGITVISVMEGLDPTTPIGKAMMTILVALGELERVQISEATRQRLKALRETKHLGRKHGSKDTVKRNTDGYKRRWAKTRGGKQPHVIEPVSIDMTSDSK